MRRLRRRREEGGAERRRRSPAGAARRSEPRAGQCEKRRAGDAAAAAAPPISGPCVDSLPGAAPQVSRRRGASPRPRPSRVSKPLPGLSSGAWDAGPAEGEAGVTLFPRWRRGPRRYPARFWGLSPGRAVSGVSGRLRSTASWLGRTAGPDTPSWFSGAPGIQAYSRWGLGAPPTSDWLGRAMRMVGSSCLFRGRW